MDMGGASVGGSRPSWKKDNNLTDITKAYNGGDIHTLKININNNIFLRDLPRGMVWKVNNKRTDTA